MAINNLTTNNYVQDTENLNAYKTQNPKTEPEVTVADKDKPVAKEPDKFKAENSNAVATNTTNKQYVKSNLDIQIKDNDGFTNMGKNDINAKVSGDVNITKDFLFDTLSKMKDSPEKKFNPPKFDADRKQYVISGKAIKAVLGVVNVNFKIRLGAVDGNLAFQVDSPITRGSIYGDLEKMLKGMGVETYRKDKLLFIKPTYTQSIDLPISKDKTHPAKLEKVETNSENTKINIDKYGNINIKLKDVQITASTDAATTNAQAAKPDTADVKFDFSLDSNMKPTANFTDSEVTIELSQEQLEKYAGQGNLDFVKENFGSSYSVSLSEMSGSFKMNENGIDLKAKTNTNVDANDSDANISTEISVDLKGKSPTIESKNLKVTLKDNQQINADKVSYDGTKPGLNVKAEGVDANINNSGVKAQVKGDAQVSKQGEAISANFKGDANVQTSGINAHVTGDVQATKQGENISATLTGKASGDVKQDGIDATFETSGNHTVNVNKTKVTVDVDLAIANAKYDTTVKTPPKANDNKPAPKIDINIKSVDLTGTVKTGAVDVNANIKEGGAQVSIGNGVEVKTDAKISGKATGERINGNVEATGANVKIGQDGSISVQANQTKADGSFKNPNHLSVDGKVTGDVNVNIDKEANIKVDTKNGTFDAKFNKSDRIKVEGKGKDASFSINKNEDIKVVLNNVEAKTDIKANTVKVNAQTKGEKVTVEAKGDDISVVTKNTTSKADVKVKEIVTTHGTVGDVNLKVSSTKKGDDVKVDVKNADMNAKIKNNNGNLNVNVDTKADVNVHVTDKGDVSIASKNAKSTDANFKLGTKIDADAQGKDFKVDIKDDDINIKVKNANFQGGVHPSEKVKVDLNTKTRSDINVSVSSKKEYDEIKVNSKSALDGHASIAGKLDSDISNKDGFNLSVRDDANGTNVKTNLNQLNLKGSVNTNDAKLSIDGKGDFNLDLKDGKNVSDINVGYKGNIKGDAKVGDKADANYNMTGKFDVGINGDDINIEADGNISANAKSDKFGVGGGVSLNGDKDNKIKVNINTKDKTQINASVNQGGLIELNDIDKLKLGKSDPVVTGILTTLKSKSAKIAYQNLDIKNNAEKVSVNVQAKDVKTQYGSFSAGLSLKKDKETVSIDKGLLVLQPNAKLFEMVKEQVSQKYKIKISGTPEIRDGAIFIKGEINSKTGITQYADFNIKATVQGDKLILDIDKAKVLKVVGTNVVNTAIDKVLNRTDIDHARISNKSMTIDLSDIVKDLTLTQGINFTGLKLEGDKIKIGFDYNSVDQDITRLAKKNDTKGLSEYIAKVGYEKLSGEALSTAYSTFANAKDLNKSSQLMVDLIKGYSNGSQNKAEIEKGLNWISKNQGMKKGNINDDITMNFTKMINIKSPEGQRLIKNLPNEIVSNLANNLDQTITQGGGMSLITSSERETANYMRQLKGLPLNKAML